MKTVTVNIIYINLHTLISKIIQRFFDSRVAGDKSRGKGFNEIVRKYQQNNYNDDEYMH